MIIEVKVPSPGESITEVQLASWLVTDGEIVKKDAEIAEIDSDKATLTINAPDRGRISIEIQEGETIDVGTVIARVDTSITNEAGTDAGGTRRPSTSQPPAQESTIQEKSEEPGKVVAEAFENKEKGGKAHISPLAKKVMEAENLSDEEVIQHVGRKRVTKSDVETLISTKDKSASSSIGKTEDVTRNGIPRKEEPVQNQTIPSANKPEKSRNTKRKKLTTLRIKLSQRLVSVKNETAMLTTFNEVNMSAIMELRKKYNDLFKEKYGVSIGFMSLFTKAATIALQQFPQINSILDGEELVYHDYVDVGIAVSSPKGLVVPVLRNTENMSIAEIELKIKELAGKAKSNKVSLEEMTGGTFTISNGGVFGSLLSTPILNPPQSAILGMHNIVERPIAQNGQVVIAPMMYLALSYDHRVVDGRESVSFLVKIKEMLENPQVMFYQGIDPVKGLLGL